MANSHSLAAIMLATLLLSFIYHVNSQNPDVFLVNVTNQIEWYNEFIYSMALKTEERTCHQYSLVVNELEDISKELSLPLTSAYETVEMVKDMVKGTNAEGCVSGISNHFDMEIKKESTKYGRCSNLPIRYWDTETNEYSDYKAYILDKINRCATSFPRRGQKYKRTICINKYQKMFNQHSTGMLESLTPSPCMERFRATVLTCLHNSSNYISLLNSKLFDNLENCINLLQYNNHQEQLSLIRTKLDFNPTLFEQIKQAEEQYLVIKKEIEGHLNESYTLQTRLKLNYVIEPRDESYIRDQLTAMLDSYNEAIQRSMADNPMETDLECGENAKSAMSDILMKAIEDYQTCDKFLVDNTLTYMTDTRAKFSDMYEKLQSLGDVAILECINSRYFWATDTIRQCYDLKLESFKLIWNETLDDLKQITKNLTNIEKDYLRRSDSFLPCGERKVRAIIHEADVVLYEYTRCMYKGSGTDYQVTTPRNNSISEATVTIPQKFTTEEMSTQHVYYWGENEVANDNQELSI